MSTISDAKQALEKQNKHVGLVGLESTYNNEQLWQTAETTASSHPHPPQKRASFPTIAFRRLAFGAKSGDLATFRSLGANEPTCLRTYIEQQLDPEQIDDSECKAVLAKHPHWNLYRQSTWQLWQQSTSETADWASHMRPLEATEQLTFLRAIHSRRQLLEKMVSFWRQHFHVYGRSYGIAPFIPDYDLMVLRTHPLGNFRQLLHTVAANPAMLLSHQNDQNRVQNINEQWARVLLTDLTLGPQSDFGMQRTNHVPTGVNGRPLGFTHDDVRATARCFTGWTVRDGRFRYRHDWHDAGGKWVMDLYIPPGQGHRLDGETLLNWLATHPATAHHISTQLCRFFLGDPPEQLIKSTAEQFIKHQDSPQQMRQVLRHIVYSRQFITTWGTSQPSYFTQTMTLIRALNLPLTMHPESETTDTFLLHFTLSEQGLFSGQPIDQPVAELFPPLARWLLSDPHHRTLTTLLRENPAGNRNANQLIHYWSQRLLGTHLPPPIHQEMIKIVAPNTDPDHPLPRDPHSWHGRQTLFRLRTALVKMIDQPLFYQT